MGKKTGSKTAFDAKRGVTTFQVPPEELVVVGYDTKHGPGEHPLYDERVEGYRKNGIDPAFVRNVRVNGVLQVIITRKDGDALQVNEGRKRTIAARLANKERIANGEEPMRVTVVVMRATDADAAIRTEIGNAGRTDDGPITKARKIARLRTLGNGESRIAIAMCLAEGELEKYESLLDLDEQLQDAVEDGSLSVSAGLKLRKLPRDEQVKAFKADGGKVTARGAGAAVAKARGRKTPSNAGPGKRQLKALVDLHQLGKAPTTLESEFVRGIRFALGDLDPMNVPGLEAALEMVAKRNAGVVPESEVTP